MTPRLCYLAILLWIYIVNIYNHEFVTYGHVDLNDLWFCKYLRVGYSMT